MMKRLLIGVFILFFVVSCGREAVVGKGPFDGTPKDLGGGEGEVIDPNDLDGDRFSNEEDNCPFVSNPDQRNRDIWYESRLVLMEGDSIPFNTPGDVVVGPEGNIYVADTANGRLLKFDGEGGYLSGWDGEDYSPDWDFPSDFAVAESGEIYLSVRMLGTSSVFWLSEFLPDSDQLHLYPLKRSYGDILFLATAPGGKKYFAWNNGHITRDAEGVYRVFFEVGLYLNGIAVDSANTIYVAVDTDGDHIIHISSEGEMLDTFGTEGDGPEEIIAANGIAIDTSGNVYVTDYELGRVQKFDSSGIFLSSISSEGSGQGQLYQPSGIYVDPLGNVYVADSGNDRIQKFVPIGDRVGDACEDMYGTSADDPDTDDDGLLDGEEVFDYHTDPLVPDSDSDGLTDREEVLAETNPWLSDTDRDTLSDAEELNRLHTNPLVVDTDGDGLGDEEETASGSMTSPTDSDTDDDGKSDALDVCPVGVRGWTSGSSTDHDSDGCKDNDAEDTDDDNDRVVDTADSCVNGVMGWSSLPGTDYDRDGCKDSDSEDSDDDNDKVQDSADRCSMGATDWISAAGTDYDGDGCKDVDVEDSDDDNDGVVDGSDSCAKGVTGWVSGSSTDHDSDGCKDGNAEDNDDDNDNIEDIIDACRSGSTGWASTQYTDIDADGCRDDSEDLDDDNDLILDNGDGTAEVRFCRDGNTRTCDDNCRLESNPLQENYDNDAQGDACDTDNDGDGTGDGDDAFPLNPAEAADSDGDGIGNNQDPDDDNDGILDRDDTSPSVAGNDLDGDGTVDSADTDDDNDGDDDGNDNCPLLANPDQGNSDGDDLGDACDPNDDDDNYFDITDNCKLFSNNDQLDTDKDGFGDACDTCPGSFNPSQDAGSCSCRALFDMNDPFAPGICYPKTGVPAASQCFCNSGSVADESCQDEYVTSTDRGSFTSSVVFYDCDAAGDACSLPVSVTCPSNSVCDQGKCASVSSCNEASDCPAGASFAYRELAEGKEIILQRTGTSQCVNGICMLEPVRQTCRASSDCLSAYGTICVDSICLPLDSCGNRVVEQLPDGEQCDDGNSIDGTDVDGDGVISLGERDGCSSYCQVEEGHDCGFDDGTTCYPAARAFMVRLTAAYRAIVQIPNSAPVLDAEEREGFVVKITSAFARFVEGFVDSLDDGEIVDADGTPEGTDSDGDGILNSLDNCPGVNNPDQENEDESVLGDACDGTGGDADGDGRNNAVDTDVDGDDTSNGEDNCLMIFNDQTDLDDDSFGDACDNDDENDGILDCGADETCENADDDNCPLIPNSGQEDGDSDLVGDACDYCRQTPVGTAVEAVDLLGCDTPLNIVSSSISPLSSVRDQIRVLGKLGQFLQAVQS